MRPPEIVFDKMMGRIVVSLLIMASLAEASSRCSNVKNPDTGEMANFKTLHQITFKPPIQSSAKSYIEQLLGYQLTSLVLVLFIGYLQGEVYLPFIHIAFRYMGDNTYQVLLSDKQVSDLKALILLKSIAVDVSPVSGKVQSTIKNKSTSDSATAGISNIMGCSI